MGVRVLKLGDVAGRAGTASITRAPTGVSGHMHAADLAPGGCGATLHLGLATSPRPALPVGFVPSFFSLWSHTPRECIPLACNTSKEGTIERASYRASWHGLSPAAAKPS